MKTAAAATIAVIVMTATACQPSETEKQTEKPCNEMTLELYNLGQLTDSEFSRRCPDLYRQASRTAQWQN